MNTASASKTTYGAPLVKVRQHQIAYRPKTNSYDAFTVGQFEREVVDCVLFGANGIKVIPLVLDDADCSPSFTVSWLRSC